MLSYHASPLRDVPPILLLSPPVTAAIFTIVLTILVWKRRRLRAGTAFFRLLLWISVAAATEVLELFGPTLEWRLLFLAFEHAATGMVAAYWFTFVWEYARGEGSLPRGARAFLWSAALLNVALAFTNPWHGLMWRGVEWPPETVFAPLEVQPGLWMPIQQALVALAGLLGSALLLHRMYTARGPLRRQAVVVLIGSLCLESGYLLKVSGLNPLEPVDFFPIAIILSSLLFTWGVLYRHLLTFTPVAREQVLDAIPALVMAVDREGRILDVNAPMEALIGLRGGQIVGKPYPEVFAAWPQEVARVQRAESYPVELPVTVQGQERHFQVTVSDLPGDGHIVLVNEVTRERLIQQELMEIHQRLNTLLDNSPDPMLIKDAEGRWQLANPAMLALFDLEGVDYRNKTDLELAEFVPFHRPALEFCVSSDQRAWEHARLYHSEEAIPRRDGEMRIFDVLKVPLFHPDGSRRELIIQARDITAQKLAEQDLRRRGVRQQLLLEISARMNMLQHPEEVYALLCRESTELLAADCGCLYWNDARQRTLYRLAEYNLPEGDFPIAHGEGVTGKVAESGKPLLIEEYADWPERLPRYRETPPPYHSVLGVPVLWQGEVQAVLVVFSRREERTFSSEDKDLLTLLAHLASGVMANTRLLEQESRQRRLSDSLRRTTLMLNASLELEQVYDHLLHEVEKLVSYDSANIMSVDAEGCIRVVSAVGYERFAPPESLEAMKGRTFQRGDLPGLERILDRQEAAVVSDTRGHAEWVSVPWGMHIRSWVGVPILVGGEVRAIFSLDSATPGFYQPQHAELLQTFASHAALAVQNAMLFERIRDMALTDALTQLPNRRYLFMLGEREIQRARRFRHPLCAIMLDIDHFKRINDTYGHAIGDEVLSGLANRLRGILRNVDILGRYGGEEFSILLPAATLEEGLNIGERLRTAVSGEMLPTAGGGIAITVSLGVAEWRADMDTLEELLDVADQGLYMAKQSGRNRVMSIQNANPALTNL